MPTIHLGPKTLALSQAALLVTLLGLSSCADFEIPALKKIKKAAETAEVDPAKADSATGQMAPSGEGTHRLTKEDLEIMRERARIHADAIAMERDLAKAAEASGVDLSFLLSMNYEEAKAISAHSVELPMGVRIAADSIEVLKKDGDDRPKKVRAKGRVYLENGSGDDMAKILCQEAYVSSWEIVLRGKPIVQRGASTIEGLDDSTVAYMLGTRLRVIGLHRASNQDAMLATLPDLGPWTSGPNPLLPALTEDSVPMDIRDQMLKAAEAEAVLQQNRNGALAGPEAPPAPWVKEATSKPGSKALQKEEGSTTQKAKEEKPKASAPADKKTPGQSLSKEKAD